MVDVPYPGFTPQTTHPNNIIYVSPKDEMKTLAIRSDFDFKFSGFRALILGF